MLRSTLDGVVVVRLREPGDTVSPNTTVLKVASTRKVWASVWMDDIGLIGSEWVEVLAGVSPGDRLLVAGAGASLPVGRRVAEMDR